MHTHFISFRKIQPPRTIRVEFAVPAQSKQEAKLIAEREAASLKGYRYEGVSSL